MGPPGRARGGAFVGKGSRPTIITLAAACGVTDGTVSRALRGDPRVAEATRQRVQAAAQRLGYRPNLSARTLRAGLTGAVGLFCEPGSWVFYNDYFGRLAAGVAAAAEAADTAMVVYLPRAAGPMPLGRLQGLEALADGRVDAGVVLGGGLRDRAGLERLRQAGLPVLLLGPDLTVPGFTQIGSGVRQRVELAAEALVRAGRRRLAWLGLFAGAPHDRLAVRTLVAWTRQRGLPVAQAEVVASADLTDPNQLAPLLERLLDKGCDGVMVANASQAAICLDVLAERGVEVPQRLSIISFGPKPYAIRARHKALALVDVDLEAAGARAFHALQRLQAGEKVAESPIAWTFEAPQGPNSLRMH